MAVVSNPLHLVDDAPSATAKLGPERASVVGRSYALRTMSEAAVKLSIASDWPVAALDPLAAVYAASFRRPHCQSNLSKEDDPQGTWPWLPAEAVPLETALMAHTSSAASALMLRDYVGALAVGMRADFIVMDRSPLLEASWGGERGCVDGGEAPRIIATFLDGKCAYGCQTGGWPWR